MRNRLIVTAAAVLLLVPVACGDDDDTGTPDPTQPPAGVTEPGDAEPGEDADDTAAGETVIEVTMSFDPGTVEISAGETVRWENVGSAPHTVTSTSGPTEFDESLPAGGSVTITFDEPGTYEYVCTIHPSMTGTIVVS